MSGSTKNAALKAWGKRVGRAGMSQAALDAIAGDHSFKDVMRIAGELKAIAIAAQCDNYWNEQVERGFDAFVRAKMKGTGHEG